MRPDQAVLQGVPFMGVQVLRWKRVILLHEKKNPENRKKLSRSKAALAKGWDSFGDSEGQFGLDVKSLEKVLT